MPTPQDIAKKFMSGSSDAPNMHAAPYVVEKPKKEKRTKPPKFVTKVAPDESGNIILTGNLLLTDEEFYRTKIGKQKQVELALRGLNLNTEGVERVMKLMEEYACIMNINLREALLVACRTEQERACAAKRKKSNKSSGKKMRMEAVAIVKDRDTMGEPKQSDSIAEA